MKNKLMLLFGTLAFILGLSLNLPSHNVSAQGMAGPGGVPGQFIATECSNIIITWPCNDCGPGEKKCTDHTCSDCSN